MDWWISQSVLNPSFQLYAAHDSCSVSYLVLDEADRMLDQGFEQDIRQIISQTKQSGRQTLMCKFLSYKDALFTY